MVAAANVVPFFSQLKFGNLLVVALTQSPKPVDLLYTIAAERQPNDCSGDWHRMLTNDLIKVAEERAELWHVREGIIEGPIPVVTPPDSRCDAILYDATTGHYIGDDGFRVPRDFIEFYERYPNYIRNWVSKRLGRYVVDEEVEDWSQDLIIHLKYLPASSKHRKPGANDRANGCTDVIETFSPVHQYGASERRFRAYINYCLGNKFNTVYSKRMKNPICRPGNLSLVTTSDSSNPDDAFNTVDDSYCHAHSEILMSASEDRERQYESHMVAKEFRAYVKQKDPDMVAIVDAIVRTSSQTDAARFLGISETVFNRHRSRLKELGRCFLDPTKRAPNPMKRRGRKKIQQQVEIVA